MAGGVEAAIRTLVQRAHECPQMQQETALVFDGAFADTMRQTGVTVHLLPRAHLRKPTSVLRARRALADLLERERFDVVLSHSPWCQVVFGPVLKKAARSALIMHAPFTGHWLQRLALRHPPEMVICNSRYTQSSLRKVRPGLRSEVVYLPVAEESLMVDRQSVRQSLGASPETIVILMASRMERWKGHFNLLSAATKLNAQTQWTIWIAGGPQSKAEHRYYDQLRNEVARLELTSRVQFLGQRRDVPSLLQASDIHCQPNKAPEPFGMIFVEAMRAAVPSVTFAMGGPQEIFDNRSGVLVPPGDIGQLVDALTLMMNDAEARVRVGRAAQERARKLFDPALQLNRLHKILSQAAYRHCWNMEEQWEPFSVPSHS